MEKAEKVVEAVKFAPFQSTDWMGYAGCEAFPDGSEPIIGYLEVDGNLAVAILDGIGLGVHVEVPTGDDEEMHEETETEEYYWDGPAAGGRALAFLRPEMASGDLLALNPTVKP